MQLSGAEKLQLNACMLRLSKEWDTESAHKVVRAFHNLPAIKLPHVVNISAETKTDIGSIISGHTNEAGNVTIKDDKPKTKITVKGEKEEEYARVGVFKIKRFGHTKTNVAEIQFWYFWASDPETMSEDVSQPTFLIEYDPNNLEPYALTRHEWEDWVEEPPSILDHVKIFFLYLIGLDAEVHHRSRESRTVPMYGTSKLGKGPRFQMLYKQ